MTTPVKPHEEVAGTENGYRWHLRRGQEPCQECRDAHRAYNDHPDWRAADAETKKVKRRGSHHVGACLDSGHVVYAHHTLPVVVHMRKIHAAHSVSKLADPRDEQAVEAWARNYPDQVCRLPFSDCEHE